jgi:hypothetical protein
MPEVNQGKHKSISDYHTLLPIDKHVVNSLKKRFRHYFHPSIFFVYHQIIIILQNSCSPKSRLAYKVIQNS